MNRRLFLLPSLPSAIALAVKMAACFTLYPVNSFGEEQEAIIDKVELSGKLFGRGPFTLHLEAAEIDAPEIQARLKNPPIYGVNSVQANPRQRVVKVVQLRLNGHLIRLSEEACRDLFEPEFLYTVHVTTSGRHVVIACAGGSGERAYRCKFYVSGGRFIKREIYQLDNESREVVSTKRL